MVKRIPESSLRSRRLEVAGERENGRARGRHARAEEASSPLACLLLARPFFLVPTTSKRLLRRLSGIQVPLTSTRECITYNPEIHSVESRIHGDFPFVRTGRPDHCPTRVFAEEPSPSCILFRI